MAHDVEEELGLVGEQEMLEPHDQPLKPAPGELRLLKSDTALQLFCRDLNGTTAVKWQRWERGDSRNMEPKKKRGSQVNEETGEAIKYSEDPEYGPSDKEFQEITVSPSVYNMVCERGLDVMEMQIKGKLNTKLTQQKDRTLVDQLPCPNSSLVASLDSNSIMSAPEEANNTW
ncbi:hypothetical protein ElyMa_001739100 [Elysia marginata]|uniref:Uncharacterized protein n=1 Tax=Elysia marginata TaxID=1093978 RepID=A0AAV4JZD4_9GAST|nr:hypothetical protein ElyMa_001739100 [Elysia marginata]